MSGIELWLYGSQARGDADEYSDTDVLAVTDSLDEAESAASCLPFKNVKVSAYSWNELKAMAGYGSLYLQHLALEGVYLSGGKGSLRLEALLNDLPRFSRARQDLDGFRAAFAEAQSSLRNGGWPDFECPIVATVARHAAILGAYCVGEPAFGRERPFVVVGAVLGYDDDDLRNLVEPATLWRLRTSEAVADGASIDPWFEAVDRFLNDLEQLVDDYSAILSRAA